MQLGNVYVSVGGQVLATVLEIVTDRDIRVHIHRRTRARMHMQ